MPDLCRRRELGPPDLPVDGRVPSQVGIEILDMRLPSRPVCGQLVEREAAESQLQDGRGRVDFVSVPVETK